MQNTAARLRPLVPSDIFTSGSLMRCCFAVFCSATMARDPLAIMRERFPTDRAGLAYLETRAATQGATTGQIGWAAELVGESVEAFLNELGPSSAAARLSGMGGLRITLEPGSNAVRIPGWTDPPPQAPFIGEALPIPLYADQVADLLAGPVKKLGILTTYSRELARLSAASRIFANRLRDMAAVSYDLAVFGDQPASAAAFAGLLNGVVPIVAPGPIIETLAALGSAVAVGGSGEAVYVMAPELAIQAKLRLDPGLGLAILPSRGVPAGRVICCDPLGLIWLAGGLPDVDVGEQSTLVSADNPIDIGVPGVPATIGAPAYSMFQTAQIALRMLLDASVAARPGAVSFADSIDWSAP